ncbi:DUF92 domain-containing protein [Paenibacillus sp. Leaf72]|uniref:DUF92 domain-containing protein n=1 Tax=Paenibacillus sp. Leaf72 TaxID=1736234 RepID=UPI0006F707BF|nr:DUF92 domain-containing protein [Paenibacillus sp. Leaf72]KQO17728.1 hypothetical protein ASF12_03405 [Paenibacillus sp. Leaf72]
MIGWIDEWWLRLLGGLVGSGLIAFVAYRFRSLSLSGALSAMAMGTGFVTWGEPVWFACLIAFFVTSTLWSKWKKHSRAKAKAEAGYEKTGRRDAGQVWANGGVGLLLCFGHALFPASGDGWLLAYIGVMAAVNADTWATEIGALSKRPPRSVTSGKVVAPGTSGAVTRLGSLAALAGAACIGVVAAIMLAWFHPASAADLQAGNAGLAGGGLSLASAVALIAVAAIAGFAGCFADSWLGATWQAMYRCTSCGSETERRTHCGVKTERTRGFDFMNNDRVNMLSSLLAGVVGLTLGLWWL